MITDLNSIFSSWLYTCNPISAHFKICRNSCVPNEYIKTTLGEISSIRCGECLVCQFFRWPTYFPIFRYQVWGVPGLPTFRWTSFPLFLRCQVRGVPGLPTFCWTSYPYFWGARFSLDLISPLFEVPGLGSYLVCQLFVGPHFPYFEVPGLGNTWSANFSLVLIFPHGIEAALIYAGCPVVYHTYISQQAISKYGNTVVRCTWICTCF